MPENWIARIEWKCSYYQIWHFYSVKKSSQALLLLVDFRHENSNYVVHSSTWKLLNIPGVLTSFGQEFRKISLSVAKCEKNRERSSFNLTIFLTKNCQNSDFAVFEIFTKSFPSKSCWDTLYYNVIESTFFQKVYGIQFSTFLVSFYISECMS